MIDKARCGAETRSGGRCKKAAGAGTGHLGVGRCKFHLGCTPIHEVNGQLQQAREIMHSFGEALPISPFDAIVQCIHNAQGEVIYATERIAELEDEQLVGPVITQLRRPLNEGKDGEDPSVTAQETTIGPPALHIWIKVRREAMDSLAKFSKLALDANIDQRIIQLEEAKAALVASVIYNILSDLGVQDDPKAMPSVRKHLALLDA